ncbi:beta-galactoside alpha-2,6-sialyltransferase 2-like [Branchiostoma floridae x Branchiostoma japonicum]
MPPTDDRYFLFLNRLLGDVMFRRSTFLYYGLLLCGCIIFYGVLNMTLRVNTFNRAKYLHKLKRELPCQLKRNVPFSTITREQASKDGNKTVLPEYSLEKMVHFNSCAVVSSSHALRFHTYGQEIDSHDAVLRFNCAPTDTFEKFVGNRTDFRLINTRIPEKSCTDEFWSDNSTMLQT